jgi:hypothetical protein
MGGVLLGLLRSSVRKERKSSLKFGSESCAELKKACHALRM